MTKMRELRDKGPNQEDTKKSVWAVLSAEQQALVQPKLDGFIKERTEERTKRMAEGQAARKVKDLEQQDQKNQPAGDKKPGKKRQPSPDQPSPDAPK
jgi:23S rRNA maturation mini-RNase III